MIVPNISVPNIQASAQHHLEAVAGVPTETSVIARIPYRAVPATVAQRETYNNTRPQTLYERLGSNAVVDEGSVPTGATSRVSIGFSAPFMTQWMAQSGANDNALIASWLKVSRPTLTSDVLEEYAQIKYLPSNAGKPLPTPQGVQAILADIQSANPRLVANVRVEQPVAQAEATVSQDVGAQAPSIQNDQLQFALDHAVESNVANRAAAAGTSAQTQMTDLAPKPVAVAPKESSPLLNRQIRFNTSLIRDTGFDAYAATFSRNMLNTDQGGYEPLRLTA